MTGVEDGNQSFTINKFKDAEDIASTMATAISYVLKNISDKYSPNNF